MQISELRAQLLEIRGLNGSPKISWAQVHRSVVPAGQRDRVSVATLWKIAERPPYEPKDPGIREILGLDEESLVLFLDGQRRPRAQAVGAVRCACGQYFISNHPRRKRCFLCGPYRGSSK